MYECNTVKNFWLEVYEWLKASLQLENFFSAYEVIFGLNAAKLDKEGTQVNSVIMYGKLYIYECKYDDRHPSLREFKTMLENRYMFAV